MSAPFALVRTSQVVFVRMISSAVASQMLLSASSFLVGLLLIRRTSDLEYGSYVLVVNALALLASLQAAFLGPAMIIRMTPLDRSARGDVIGGLYREGGRLLRPVAWSCVVMAALLWLTGVADSHTELLLLAAVAAALAALRREYFRGALLAHRRAPEVLRADLIYAALLVAGAAVATLAPLPAVVAVVTMSLAAFAGSALLAHSLRRSEAWNAQGAPGILRDTAPLAGWATAGAAIHWTFSQGYSYLVAATLDVTAVAAIAATRLLLMPINMLSTGIGSLMLPLTSGWLLERGVRPVFRRLLAFALGLAAAALLYLALMWLARDWIFAVVLKKNFAQRDAMLALWAAIVLMMVLRDQLMYLLQARERFRSLTVLTLLSATVSLAVSYVGMLRLGVAGALWGVLVGEMISAAGILALTLRETRRPLSVAQAA